jgi:hypothetical protein
VIRDFVFNRETTKPTTGKVHFDISAQRPLRAGRKQVADDEHHQHRIDGWSTNPRIKGRLVGWEISKIALGDQEVMLRRLPPMTDYR